MVQKWTELFITVAEKYIPTKEITVRPSDPPWLSNHLRRQIRKRNRIFRKAKLRGTPELWSRYKKGRNQVTNDLRKAKQQYSDSLVNKIENDGQCNPKLWWKLVMSCFTSFP